ncbi:MAG: hypothetical protein CMA00_001260 [Methanobacteriota archaeon]|nr:MAG: hypothetical protein CMA00_001260 [Euryarchaeota archaeon]
MVNLFRLLGLPNPSNTPKVSRSGREGQSEPGPRPGNRFHDLGESRWADRTERVTDRPIRRVIYMQPDDLHRLQMDGIEGNLSMGDMAIFDLTTLNHMPSQQSVCSRRVQDLGDRSGLPVFSLNEDDTMLMVAGAMMRVDTHKHRLGSPALDRAIQND